SPALQIAAGDPAEIVPTHLPPTQPSTSVHMFPSSQAAVLGVCTHASAGRSAVASQLSSVQTFASSQLSGGMTPAPLVVAQVAGMHTVPLATQAIAAADGSPRHTRSAHMSGPVQALLSLHAVGPETTSMGGLQPSVGSQTPSATHGFGGTSALHTSGGTVWTQLFP